MPPVGHVVSKTIGSCHGSHVVNLPACLWLLLFLFLVFGVIYISTGSLWLPRRLPAPAVGAQMSTRAEVWTPLGKGSLSWSSLLEVAASLLQVAARS